MDLSLNDIWILYFHAKDKTKKYSDNTTKIYEIDTFGNFWGTFNNIPTPYQIFLNYNKNRKLLKINCAEGVTPAAYSFFRKSSYPTWEDDSNKHGFEWSIKIFKDLDSIDELWLDSLLTLVCENFDYSEKINGIRIVDCSIDNLRISYRFEIWFNDKKFKNYFEENINDIFKIFKCNQKLIYRDHQVLKEL